MFMKKPMSNSSCGNELILPMPCILIVMSALWEVKKQEFFVPAKICVWQLHYYYVKGGFVEVCVSRKGAVCKLCVTTGAIKGLPLQLVASIVVLMS